MIRIHHALVTHQHLRMSPHRRHLTIAIIIAVVLLMFAIVVAHGI